MARLAIDGLGTGTPPPRRRAVLPACLHERATPPGEVRLVPAGHRRQGRAVPGGVHDPPIPDVDTHVTDLARPRAGAIRAEEDDVTRCQRLAADALRSSDLAAPLIRRPSDEHVRQLR